MPSTAAGRGRTGVDQLQQAEQGGGRVADRDDRAVEPLAPQLQRRGAAGGAEAFGELGHPGVAQGADDLVARGQPRRG